MSYHAGIDELWQQAEREEARKVIAVLPDPRRVAESLRYASLTALIHAVRDRHGDYRLPANQRGTNAWKELVAAGIVESGWGGIGNFGMRVRKEAIAMAVEMGHEV